MKFGMHEREIQGRTDNGAEEGLVFGWAEDVAVDDLPAVLVGAQEVLVADDRAALLHVVARKVLRTHDRAYALVLCRL